MWCGRTPFAPTCDTSFFTIAFNISILTAVRFDGRIHHRRSIRLRSWDYGASGAYFLTLCTEGRRTAFGSVIDNEMRLNSAGDIVMAEWLGCEKPR
jgi:hypothetical protein